MGKTKEAAKAAGKAGWRMFEQSVGEGMGKEFSTKFGQKATERIFEDKRGELLVDILSIPGENETLRRRQREALANHTENRFVNLLCKIPKNERREALKKLNKVNDEEFEEYLSLLENDILTQFFQRIEKFLGENAEEIRDLAIEGMKSNMKRWEREKREREMFKISPKEEDRFSLILKGLKRGPRKIINKFLETLSCSARNWFKKCFAQWDIESSQSILKQFSEFENDEARARMGIAKGLIKTPSWEERGKK